jgi:YggT family protein|tara:strand:+ start:2031 stop:2318 length:288 start_codon:yes stop_codon:yes gene_type:complete
MTNLLLAIAGILNTVFELLFWIILIRCLISWVNPDPYNRLVYFMGRITEPLLEPIREVVPQYGGIDWSPFIAALALHYLGQVFLVRSLIDLAYSF